MPMMVFAVCWAEAKYHADNYLNEASPRLALLLFPFYQWKREVKQLSQDYTVRAGLELGLSDSQLSPLGALLSCPLQEQGLGGGALGTLHSPGV